jgi:hypothetical protein
MNYDSEEARKQQKKFAELLKETRLLLADKKDLNLILSNAAELQKSSQAMQDRIKAGERLSAEELQMLDMSIEAVEKAAQLFLNMKDMLDYDRALKTEAQFHYLKKLADEGNVEAKKAYEKIREGRKENLNSPENLN